MVRSYTYLTLSHCSFVSDETLRIFFISENITYHSTAKISKDYSTCYEYVIWLCLGVSVT